MKKISYRNLTYTRTKLVNNILFAYHQTEEEDRFDWYMEAHNYAIYLSRIFNVSIIKTAGILAALSPLKSWDRNKKIAYSYLKNGISGHTKIQTEKARLILELATTEEEVLTILSGQKTRSFYLNILHPAKSEHITIDRHALTVATKILTTDQNFQALTRNQYDFFVEAFIHASKKVGVSPLLMQSATWVWVRKNKDLYKSLKI